MIRVLNSNVFSYQIRKSKFQVISFFFFLATQSKVSITIKYINIELSVINLSISNASIKMIEQLQPSRTDSSSSRLSFFIDDGNKILDVCVTC